MRLCIQEEPSKLAYPNTVQNVLYSYLPIGIICKEHIQCHLLNIPPVNRPNLSFITPQFSGMNSSVWRKYTRIVPTSKSAMLFRCISTFSMCYGTLIRLELFNCTCSSREIQVFVFRMVSKCRTDLTDANSDDSYRFWRLTRLFARENSTEVWCAICEDDFRGK